MHQRYWRGIEGAGGGAEELYANNPLLAVAILYLTGGRHFLAPSHNKMVILTFYEGVS